MGHNRPMAELLSPQAQDIEALYREELEDMSYEPIDFEQICETLPRLLTKIHSAISDADRRFLLELKQGTQDWGKFSLPSVEQLPAIRWKMLNLGRMKPSRRKAAIEKLEKVLFG